ncbi:hypothetical protein, partial [Pseudoflavonifractor capillosus]
GEREGAAARLAWNRMPRKPCCARLPESGAGTFAPLCGAKVTAFLQAVAQSAVFMRKRALEFLSPWRGGARRMDILGVRPPAHGQTPQIFTKKTKISFYRPGGLRSKI